jgi:hypothetical protein
MSWTSFLPTGTLIKQQNTLLHIMRNLESSCIQGECETSHIKTGRKFQDFPQKPYYQHSTIELIRNPQSKFLSGEVREGQDHTSNAWPAQVIAFCLSCLGVLRRLCIY